MDVMTSLTLALLAVVLWLYKRNSTVTALLNKTLYGNPISGPTGWNSMLAFLSGARHNNLHVFASECARKYGDVVRVSGETFLSFVFCSKKL